MERFQHDREVIIPNIIDINDLCECDGFTKTGNPFHRVIQNINHQYLCLDGQRLVYEPMTKSRLRAANCKFIFQLYNNPNGGSSLGGKPVMLQIKRQEKVFTMFCDQQKDVLLKDYVVPESFEDRHHDALFFLRNIEGHKYMRLESAKWPQCYLSFENAANFTVCPTVTLQDDPKDINERSCLVIINPTDL